MSKIRIEQSSVQRDFFALFQEDGSIWRVVHKSLYQKILRDFLQRLSFEEFKEQFNLKESGYARACALDLLSKRCCFTIEVKEALLKKGFSIDSVGEAISYAQKMGFLSDKTRLSFVMEKLIRKGKGKHLIIAHLSKYQFDRQTIEEALQSLSFEPREEIERLIEKKIGNGSLDDPNKKSKIILFLQRKGFALEEILDVIRSRS
ncbi:MAG: regulatory protein RecX [Chlamydiia bacterium]|jgi:regulatory protein|nr:regulatory protein RecX [Chlamydiia bacterium]